MKLQFCRLPMHRPLHAPRTAFPAGDRSRSPAGGGRIWCQSGRQAEHEPLHPPANKIVRRLSLLCCDNESLGLVGLGLEPRNGKFDLILIARFQILCHKHPAQQRYGCVLAYLA